MDVDAFLRRYTTRKSAIPTVWAQRSAGRVVYAWYLLQVCKSGIFLYKYEQT